MTDMKMRSISAALVSETWQRETKKRHVNEVQRMLYIEGPKFVSPVWNSGLTQQEERGLERIQRTALAIIRGEKHATYQEALDYFGIKKNC